MTWQGYIDDQLLAVGCMVSETKQLDYLKGDHDPSDKSSTMKC